MEKNKPESIVTTNKIKFSRPDFTATPESQKAESIVTTNKVDFGGIYKALQAKDDAIFAQQVTSTQFADAKQRAKAAGIAKRLKIDNVDLVQQNIDEYEAADKRKQFEDYVKLNPAIRDMDADKRDEFLKRISDEKTAEQLYRINNNLRVYGREERPFAPVAFAKKMSYSWNKGKQTTVKTGRRVADIMKSRNLSEYEERQLLNAIKDEQKEYPELASNPLSKLFYMGAETLPYTLKTGSWTFGGEIAGTGASMLLKRWPVAAVVSKIAGRAVGAIGAFNEGKEIEAGNLYLDLMTMKDDDGNVIDRETCQAAAEIYGSVSAAIETAGSEMLTGVALKANFLKRAVLKKQILDLAKNKGLKHWLAEFGKRAVVADLSEAAEEGLQEAASVFMENRAKAAANENGADFALSDYAERVTDATIKGGQGAVVISFAGAGSGTAISARENRRLMAARSNKTQAEAVAMADKAVLDEIQKDAEQALPTPETQEDAARNRQFFQKAFKSSLYDKVYLEIEDAEAFLASDAYQANKEWLDEIGFTDLFNKKIALAKDISGVVSLSAADYATYITPKKDVYSEFTKNMKTSEDGMKLGEAEERGKMRVEILRRGEQLTREREADADFLREYFDNRYDGAALQRKPFVEYMTKVALTMSERANMTVRDFVRAYPFGGVLKGYTGEAPSVSAYDEILSAIRDEIRSNPEEAVRRVSEAAAKKDIRAIRNILSKKIENANSGDIKKFIRLANAIRDMKLDLSNMTDDQIQNALHNFTTAPDQSVASESETTAETGDLFKTSGASKAESALKDIQETGGDYVVIGSGRVPVAYEVRDISTINTSHTAEGAINPNYPQRFQPRDRSDIASREQIQNIVSSFMPERVGVNAVANEGAPIIDANGNVLVGNGRAMAISEVLKNPEKAAAYKEYIKSLGYLSDMENPILVRRLTGDMTDEQLDALVADANASGTMRYSVAEQALTDASKMTPNLLNALDVDADIGSAANKEFVKGVFNDVIPSGERNGLMVNGQITQDGIERIEDALVAMLVQDKALLDTLLTKDATGKNDNRKIASGLAKASPAVLYFENEIENKKTIDPAYSIADDVRGAVYVLKRAIGKKMPLNDYLAQMDFLEGGVSAAVQYVARIFDTMPNAAEVRNRITDYIRLASTEGDLMQGGLFATPSQTKEQILQSVSGKQPALYQKSSSELSAKISKIDADRLAFERKNINPELNGRENEEVKAVKINRFFSDREKGDDIADDEVISKLDETVKKNDNGVRVLENENGETVTLSNGSLGEMLGVHGTADNIGGVVNKEAIANLPAIFRTAIKIKETDDIRHGKQNKIIRYANVFESNDEPIMVKITVKQLKGNRKLLTAIEFEKNGNRDLLAYSLKTAKKNTSADALKESPADKSYGNNASDKVIISDLIEYINTFTDNEVEINGEWRKTRNSAGQRIAKTEEGLRAFYEWFGDSKAVDEYNRPLVVYHGSPEKNIVFFDKSKIGKRDFGFFGKGFNFTPNKGVAEAYAGSKEAYPFYSEKTEDGAVYPVYLNIKNPRFVSSDQEGNIDSEKLKEGGYDGVVVYASETFEEEDRENKYVKEEIEKAKGYKNKWFQVLNYSDEVVGIRWITEIVAFEPEQIKSVENIGSFSKETQNIYYQKGNAETTKADINSAEFKKWSHNAPFYEANKAAEHNFKTGEPLVAEVFHGTQRADRVGDTFLPSRATSGPMAFSTDTRFIAENYAKDKNDTSIYNETEGDFYKYYTVKIPNHDPVTLDRLWNILPYAKKKEVREKAPHITLDDNGENVVYDEKETRGNGGYYIEGNQNPINALVESWPNAGYFFDEMEKFQKVLELAGLGEYEIQYIDPYASYPKVYELYVEMQNPLVTKDIPKNVLTALKREAKNQPRKTSNYGADPWDKNTKDPIEWINGLDENNTYIWTSIPDWVTNTLKKMGYDGIVDTGGKSGGYGHNVFIPFESQQYKSVYNEGAFDPNNPSIYYQPQNEFSAPFGAYDPIRRQITIFENSNLSTILHESGHFWYDVFKQIAQKEGVSDRLKNDYKTLDKWLTEEAAKRYTIRKNEATKEYEIIRVSSGAVENSFLTEDEAVNATKHECFARGLEAYFRDFDVPVAGLSRVFAMFRRWLMGVYRSAKALDIKIIPPVREVFDRMIATDEEILEYQSAVRMKKILDKSGTTLMTDEDFEKYSEMFKEASDVSRENYMKAQAEVVAREQTRQFKERKEQIREREIEEKCRTDKKFLIDRVLMFGKVGEVEYPDMTLDEEEVTRAFKQINVKRWRLRPNGKPIFKAGGMKMSEVAQFFGVTIDEVADAVFHINQNLDNFEKELTEIVHEELGDPVSVDDILERLRKSNATDIQQEILLTELSVLTGSETNKTMLDRIMKNFAEDRISKLKLRDLKPQVFQRNALRAQDKAVYFAQRKNIKEAARWKERQIRNFYLQRECERQLDVAQKSVKRLQEIGKFKKEVNRFVEQTHQDAARALLSRFGLAVSMTQAAQERAADLAKFVTDQAENGYDIALPDQRLLEMKRTSYRDLTVDDFLTIRDCVLSIIYNGRQIKEFELEGEKVRKDEAIQKIEEALSGRESIKRSATSNKSKKEENKDTLKSLDASLTTLGGLAQMVDGANMNGIFHKLYLRPLTEAQNLEFYLNEKYAAKVGKQMKKLPSSIKERLLDVVDGSEEVLGQAYNMEDLISFGLNMGTYSNLQRLKDGNRFTDTKLQWIKDQIPVEAWEFIQGVWDVLDEMRPMLQDHQKKMSGLDMDEVIAVPFMVGNREFRGGYYPIVYDYSAFSEARKANSTAEALLESDYGRPTTATGYTKARADKVRMPVKTGLGVLSNHIQAVIHDVAYRKTLRDLWNITTDQHFIEVFDEKIGIEYREALQSLLKSIGNKVNRDNRELHGVNKVLKTIRHRATFIGLAYRLSSALAQLPGLASSVAWLSDVGKKSGAKHGGAYWIAKGCRDIINPDVRQWIEAKSGEVKARLSSSDQNLSERIRALRGKDTIRASVETYGYWFLGHVDFLVSLATWKGAYEQAINDLGYGEQDAIFYADRAMNESQGSGNIKETVAFQRHDELMKMVSMFYTPFAAEYQLNKRLFNDLFHVKDLAGFTNVLSRSLALYLVSGCLGDIIAGNAPDKDESWLAWAIKSSLKYMIGAYPVLREWSSAKFGSAGKMPYGRWFDNASQTYDQLIKAMEGNISVKTAVKAAMTTLAYGWPSVSSMYVPIPGQLADTTSYLAALIADEVKPKSFSDILLGLYKGRERK